MFHSGDMTIALTSLSPARIMAQRVPKKKRKSDTARAVRAMVAVWKCDQCGALMPLNNSDKPPKRCSNRATCGKMFFNGKDS